MKNTDYRIEKDTMGEVKVPLSSPWGAQTQRSINNFSIGTEKLPIDFIKAYLIIKKSCAKVNNVLLPAKMTNKKYKAIAKTCDALYKDFEYDYFPLSVWQTGSGTQTNMNINEVIANITNKNNSSVKCHPNDDINMSQSTNDTFPTAISLSFYLSVRDKLIPALDDLIKTFKELEMKFSSIIKCGRTHFQDATPIKFSSEISSWRTAIETSKKQILLSMKSLYDLPVGGTAVGTSLNAPKDFDKLVVSEINKATNEKFVASKNKYHAMSFKDAVLFTHSSLKVLASNLIKIASDIRILSSGPNTGIGEITIPSNEPGSSIMPGKVNPTQCEAMIMISMQVQGNDLSLTNAASSGILELNVCMPLIAYNVLQSVELLSDGINSFTKNCISGIDVNKEIINFYLDNNLSNATVLNTVLGYDKVATIVKKAHKEKISVKESCVKLGYLTEKEFDKLYNLNKMV